MQRQVQVHTVEMSDFEQDTSLAPSGSLAAPPLEIARVSASPPARSVSRDQREEAEALAAVNGVPATVLDKEGHRSAVVQGDTTMLLGVSEDAAF
jgi:hypothetical protein